MRLIWGSILISTSSPPRSFKVLDLRIFCLDCILWFVVFLGWAVGFVGWDGTDGRYDQINVTYKSTEKIVPIMKVSPPSSSD